MRTSLLIASVLATLAVAAPTSSWTRATGSDTQAIADYFNSLAAKVQQTKKMSPKPVCDLSTVQFQNASPSPLPPPSAGLVLKHIAVGRGTQNYTCGTNSSAAPVSIGAEADLFNISCIASIAPDLVAQIPNFVLQFNIDPTQPVPNPAGVDQTGQHHFLDNTTPFFNLDVSPLQLGQAACTKNNTAPAPASATLGQGGKGNGSVAYLKLLTRDGATGGLEEIYRLNTAGGNPPTTCAGMPAAFQVQYAATYHFYASP